MFFYKQHFYKQRRLKLTKNQATAEQHPAELLLFENYSLSSSMLSSKNNRRYSKKIYKSGASILMKLYD